MMNSASAGNRTQAGHWRQSGTCCLLESSRRAVRAGDLVTHGKYVEDTVQHMLMFMEKLRGRYEAAPSRLRYACGTSPR